MGPETGNPDRARERLFIGFISLIIKIHIQNRRRNHNEEVLRTGAEKDSVNGVTVDDVLQSLSTVSDIGNTGAWMLTVVSKNIKEIFKVFGLEPPTSGKMVLERCGLTNRRFRVEEADEKFGTIFSGVWLCPFCRVNRF